MAEESGRISGRGKELKIFLRQSENLLEKRVVRYFF